MSRLHRNYQWHDPTNLDCRYSTSIGNASPDADWCSCPEPVNSDQITIHLATGWRYPSTVPLKATPLWVSEHRDIVGGEEISAKFEIPKGSTPMRVAFVLVRVDDIRVGG